MATAPHAAKKALVSSIPLWFRTDQPRQTGVDYWRGPHWTGPFRKHLHELARTLADTGELRELRTQVFMPWNEKLWDTPNVAHDNPVDQQFHASLILGFADPAARAAFFESPEVARMSDALAPFVSAIHAYDVTDALTFVKGGKALQHFER
jgi:hypothetical protein